METSHCNPRLVKKSSAQPLYPRVARLPLALFGLRCAVAVQIAEPFDTIHTPTWHDLAEAWHLPLSDFLGLDPRDRQNWVRLPDFDPFQRIHGRYRYHSLECRAAGPVRGTPGFRLALVRSRIASEAMTAALLDGEGQRVGYVERLAVENDVVSLAPHLRGQGLAAPMILAAMKLRAHYRMRAAPRSVVSGVRALFFGGCYSRIGLAACAAAHRLAISRALKTGRTMAKEVLDDQQKWGDEPLRACG